jgi:Domain of unknown function (DUF4440)
LSSELKSADLEGDDLSREILVCENKVYATFLGPQPDVEAFQKLTLPDYLTIPPNGVILTREENVIALKSGVAFSSIQIKNSQVRKLSPTSALIVARVRYAPPAETTSRTILAVAGVLVSTSA